MNLVISLDDGINIDDLLIKKLNKIVSIILEQEMVSECEINLRLMNDIEMQKLNMQFRQKNKTTNVLSFPNDDVSVKQTKNIGDIAISIEYVNYKDRFINIQRYLWGDDRIKKIIATLC